MKLHDLLCGAATGTYVFAALALAAAPYGLPAVLAAESTTAWVQAIGSIGAIIASVMIALHVMTRQLAHAEAVRLKDSWERERREYAALLGFAEQAGDLSDLHRDLTGSGGWNANACQLLTSRFNRVSQALASMALKDLPDPGRDAVVSLQAATDGFLLAISTIQGRLPNQPAKGGMSKVSRIITESETALRKALDAHLEAIPKG